MTHSKGNGFLPKTNARLAAVQALYAFLMTGDSLEAIKHAFLTGKTGSYALLEDENGKESLEPLPAFNAALFSDLLSFFSENEKQINVSVISALSENWPADRLETLLKAIMLTGATELFAFPSTDTKIILNEYIELTKSFYPETEYKIVNAVLQKIAQVIRT